MWLLLSGFYSSNLTLQWFQRDICGMLVVVIVTSCLSAVVQFTSFLHTRCRESPQPVKASATQDPQQVPRLMSMRRHRRQEHLMPKKPRRRHGPEDANSIGCISEGGHWTCRIARPCRTTMISSIGDEMLSPVRPFISLHCDLLFKTRSICCCFYVRVVSVHKQFMFKVRKYVAIIYCHCSSNSLSFVHLFYCKWMERNNGRQTI